MADTPILDLLAFVGGTADSGPFGPDRMVTLLDRCGVAGAAVVSTRAVFVDAARGNLEAREAAGIERRLLPITLLDPRPIGARAEREGVRLACLLPAMQGWPADYAPARRLLGDLTASGGALPLLWEARRPGDATAIGLVLRDLEYPAPVVLTGIDGAVGLAEGMAVAASHATVHIATDGLRGVGEVAAAVRAVGADRVVFASGAPLRSLGAALALVRHAEISEDDRAKLFFANARRLLGLGVAAGGPA